jgi:hypothetical protein
MEKTMSLRDLNWRKGFFRLWLLASSVWVIICGIAEIPHEGIRYIGSLKGVQEFFLLPVIALILGMGVVWAFSVFAPKRNK